MNRNTIIGVTLIFLLFYIWAQLNAPTPEELAERERLQKEIKLEEAEEDIEILDTLQDAGDQEDTTVVEAEITETLYTLENDLMTITFSSIGAQMQGVVLKNYQKLILTEDKEEVKLPLELLADRENSFSVNTDEVKTADLNFHGEKNGNELSFVTGRFRITYTLDENDYQLKQKIETPFEEARVEWVNHLDKIERNTSFEQFYSTIYYKPSDDDVDYLSYSGDDEYEVTDEKLWWVCHSNQFFNSTIFNTVNGLENVLMTSHSLEEDDEDLKIMTTSFDLTGKETNLVWYIGPNNFSRLNDIGYEFSDIIPFGWSIFGTINRWIIRPMFNFLSNLIGIPGLVILVLTLIVKLALYPLSYKMLKSQAKMQVLRPELGSLKEKYKDDPSKQQMETMKIYREYGVNPLGGCMPMVIQMPIWFALYRFFPASLEFRQAPFLWATDLSSYDVIAYLPFYIPFYGEHISLFTLIWVVTTIAYTFYNSKQMSFGQMNNPAMKYMQYFFPVMLLFLFNNYSSGLTVYLCFSNIFNVAQIIVTKNLILDYDKIKQDLNINKLKPKKKGRMAKKFDEMMKEQKKRMEASKKKK